MWSITFIPNNFPTSFNCLVIIISLLEGLTLPEGWLWIQIILVALNKYASLNTSLGWTRLWLIVPINNNLSLIIWFLVSR